MSYIIFHPLFSLSEAFDLSLSLIPIIAIISAPLVVMPLSPTTTRPVQCLAAHLYGSVRIIISARIQRRILAKFSYFQQTKGRCKQELLRFIVFNRANPCPLPLYLPPPGTLPFARQTPPLKNVLRKKRQQ